MSELKKAEEWKETKPVKTKLLAKKLSKFYQALFKHTEADIEVVWDLASCIHDCPSPEDHDRRVDPPSRIAHIPLLIAHQLFRTFLALQKLYSLHTVMLCVSMKYCIL